MNRQGENIFFQALRLVRATRWLVLIVLLVLSGCISIIDSDRQEPKDGGPARPVDVSDVSNAVPRDEPRKRAGNASPYTVFGKTYQVLKSSRGYRQTGIASWYGTKFHGKATANGEVYDMYAMTAAHKSLPIPSYVKVTNLDNSHSVIVRVNDRGPFHGGRIIDLTYAAAKKLNFVDKGTARVNVVAVHVGETPSDSDTEQPQPSAVIEPFLQAGAFGSESAARELRQRLTKLISLPITVKQNRGENALYRVHIGPIVDMEKIQTLKVLLQQQQQVSAHVVYE